VLYPREQIAKERIDEQLATQNEPLLITIPKGKGLGDLPVLL